MRDSTTGMLTVARVTVRSNVFFPRFTVRRTSVPAGPLTRATPVSSGTPFSDLPSTSTMRSPCFRPARDAGDSS